MKNEEFLELLDRYQDNDLSESEVAQLRDFLKEHPDARTEFIRDRLIGAAFEMESVGVPEVVDFPKPKQQKKATFGWWPAITAGLVFFIGLGLGSVLRSPDSANPEVADATEPSDDGVALVTQSAYAKWSEGARPGAGGILSPGVVKLESGLAQIEFYSGARVALEGPAELELISATEAICRSGKLRAFVPPHARGFTVKSAQFELVDLGTEFGIDVGPTGEAKVHVFDGEVEIYPPNGERAQEDLKRLLGGAGMAWNESGKAEVKSSGPEQFPSFQDVKNRTAQISKNRFASWQKWHEATLNDPRIIAYYDFQNDETGQLLDRSQAASNGSIVGSEWTTGRWPEKTALEFKRPGDRVRLDIPGEFDNLTMAAWIRMDAQTGRYQSLLLTDRFEVGRVHWQFSSTGALRLGIRLPNEASNPNKIRASGYSTDNIFGTRRIGTWNLVTTVYDQTNGKVRHHLNGRKISDDSLVFDQPLQIGSAEIGNWGIALDAHNRKQKVRNFVGRIDEMTLWKTALSTEEIREMYLKTRP